MQLVITLDGTDPKATFAAGAFWREYQQHCSKCGVCGGTEIIPSHRHTVAKTGSNAGKAFDFYEAVCCGCGARFQFGQKMEDKSLFPKAQEGWTKFNKEGGGQQRSAQGSQSYGVADDGDDSVPF